MLKKELIEELKEHFPQFSKKDMESFIDLFFEVLEEGVKSGRVEIRRFGVFTSKIKSSHQLQHPKTKKIIKTKPHRTIRFKPSFKVPLEIIK